MVIENQYPPYFEWLLSAGVSPGALWIWLLTVVGVLVGGLLLSFVVLAVRTGPAKAGDLIYRTLTTCFTRRRAGFGRWPVWPCKNRSGGGCWSVSACLY